MLRVFCICLTAFSSLTPAVQAATIIHAARLIDGRRDEPREKVSIVVAEGRIQSVVDGYTEPGPDDKVIRLTEHTVMPGLMDMHTHLQS